MWYDCYFYQWRSVWQELFVDGVFGFMVSDNFFFVRGDEFVFFFQAVDDVIQCEVEVIYIYCLFIVVGSYECGFVVNVGNICFCKVWCYFCQSFSIDFFINFNIVEVYFKDGYLIFEIWVVNIDLLVKMFWVQ